MLYHNELASILTSKKLGIYNERFKIQVLLNKMNELPTCIFLFFFCFLFALSFVFFVSFLSAFVHLLSSVSVLMHSCSMK